MTNGLTKVGLYTLKAVWYNNTNLPCPWWRNAFWANTQLKGITVWC